MPAAVSIHCCERTARPLSASASGGLLRDERSSDRTASRCSREYFKPPHQNVEQPLARGFFGHVVHVLRENRAVGGFDICREHGKRRGKFAADLSQREAAPLRDVVKTDGRKRFVFKKHKKRGDDFLAVGLGASKPRLGPNVGAGLRTVLRAALLAMSGTPPLTPASQNPIVGSKPRGSKTEAVSVGKLP